MESLSPIPPIAADVLQTDLNKSTLPKTPKQELPKNASRRLTHHRRISTQNRARKRQVSEISLQTSFPPALRPVPIGLLPKTRHQMAMPESVWYPPAHG
jgi:hypothetical protein